mgnify:CR=1 FL=1
MSDEKGLTKEIVEQFVADEDSVDLKEFTALEDDATESLSKYQGKLDLDGLTSLSDAAAESLSKHDGNLFLDGLTDLSDAAVESLSRIRLADDITTDDLKATLIAQCEIAGEAGKYEGDCHLVHTETWYLCDLWNAISEASGTDLPGIDEVRVFDSHRKHADCPIGEVSFIFSWDAVYESKLNSGGEFLQKLCGGYLNEVTWTDVSY